MTMLLLALPGCDNKQIRYRQEVSCGCVTLLRSGGSLLMAGAPAAPTSNCLSHHAALLPVCCFTPLAQRLS